MAKRDIRDYWKIAVAKLTSQKDLPIHRERSTPVRVRALGKTFLFSRGKLR
jgi:hypothetical protein